MSRYIDADAFKKDVKHHLSALAYAGSRSIGLDVLSQWLDNAPTIEIVRCKECTERDDDWCMYFGKMINPDDFCSYGEREDE